MAEAILDLRLDTVQPNRVRLVYGVQNDYNSRYICARFTVNGKPIDIEKTAAVRINAKRPDGNKDAFPGTVNTDGTAKVPVAQWMLDVPGEVSASITAVTTSGALTTQEFYIMAKASLWDSTGEPSAENPDKDVLQTIIASENERVAAESTRVANENARKSAETARATAETKRIADEAERVANEAGRVSAEEIRREEFATWQDEWGKISSFDKRIENLEAAVSPGLVTPTIDDAIAYRKTVPKGVLPNAAVCEVGGMTYRCENLAIPNIFTQWLTTANIADDGKITMTCTGDGTPFCIAFKATLKAGESYYVKLHNINSISRVVFFKDSNASTGSLMGFTSEGVYTATSDITIYIGVYMHDNVASGTVGSCYVMLNKGSTALPYQPYFEGLRDSKVEAIESVGANLISFPYNSNEEKINGVNWTVNPDGTVVANGTADGGNSAFYLTDELMLSAGDYVISGVPASAGYNATVTMYCVDDEGQQIPIKTSSGEYSYVNAFGDGALAITIPRRAKATIYTQVIKGSTCSNLVFKPMLNRGSTALPYTLYFRESLPIPADALDGFGHGVSKDCYNKIVLDPLEGVKKYRQICAKRGYLAGDETRADVLTDGKNETVYILENPVETDVSAYFTDDNLLHVEAGGTITAVNEYEQAVPFSIEYTVKGA